MLHITVVPMIIRHSSERRLSAAGTADNISPHLPPTSNHNRQAVIEMFVL